ncbi:unnamed protein product [Acanthoscelides obtectus]|uniref:Uncharacterized protein n=1 Tax=Acanthoscelides obtectus TaxID=200917 RepID=A0A9P0PZM2_ACAOB|nr:unnamed protein product [Acanthoscelides obtectus]CAK1680538.1 hypothetical protein AOBTE_LOCUS32739 [Acanthoscelides obtectus]
MTTDIELQEFIQIRPAEAAVLENTTDNPTTTPLPAVKAHISPSKSFNQHIIERTKKTTTKQPNSQTGIKIPSDNWQWKWIRVRNCENFFIKTRNF